MTQTIRVGVPCDSHAHERFLSALDRMAPDLEAVTVPLWTVDDPSVEVTDGVLDKSYEDALADGDVDVFAGPMERMPFIQDPRVHMAAVMRRDDLSYLVTPVPLEGLSVGSTVKVCCPVVREMLSESYPDLDFTLEDTVHDATVSFPYAMVPRTQVQALDPLKFIPMAGQGAVAVMCRKDDADTRSLVSRINHPSTRVETSVELSIMKLMGAVNIAPVAVNAVMEGDAIKVRAVSYGYTDEPRRMEGYLPLDFVMDEVLSISEYLVGKRDYIL